MTTVLHRPTDCSHGSLSHWWTFFASVHDRFNKAKLIQSTISRDLVARTKYQVIGILMIFEVLSLFLKNGGTFNDFVKRAYLLTIRTNHGLRARYVIQVIKMHVNGLKEQKKNTI